MGCSSSTPAPTIPPREELAQKSQTRLSAPAEQTATNPVDSILSVDEFDWHTETNLSEHQKQLRDQLRERLEGLGLLVSPFCDDTAMLRFLKKTWDVDAAVSQYKKMVLWRKEMQIDTLIDSFDFPELPEILQHQPHFYHKQDRFGRPVYVLWYGQFDAAKVLSLTTVERYMKYYIWRNEHYERFVVPAVSGLLGKPVFEYITILDIKGFSLKNLTADTRRASAVLAQVSQDFYPEQMGLTFVINTPKMFKALWTLTEKLVSERMRRRIIVLGDDYQEVLKSFIPEENLLEVYGGKSKMPENFESVGAWMDVEPCKSASYNPVGNIHATDK